MLIEYFCCFTVLKLNTGDVRFICLETQTSIEKKSSFKVFFITQIGHTPGFSNSNCSEGETRTKKNKAALWLWRNKGGTWSLLETTFTYFFPANGIVSYREFISSPFYVRFKWTCWLAGLALLNINNKLNNMLIVSKFPQSIAGRTKCPRGLGVWDLCHRHCYQ